MFDKEAEVWVKDHVCKDCSRYKECKSKEHCTCKDCSKEKWQNGAEFGYNKANEWYKVADGTIPKENKRYLVQIKDNGLAIAYFNGQHWETRYNLGESGHCVETVIAWREIPTFEE